MLRVFAILAALAIPASAQFTSILRIFACPVTPDPVLPVIINGQFFCARLDAASITVTVSGANATIGAVTSTAGRPIPAVIVGAVDGTNRVYDVSPSTGVFMLFVGGLQWHQDLHYDRAGGRITIRPNISPPLASERIWGWVWP